MKKKSPPSTALKSSTISTPNTKKNLDEILNISGNNPFKFSPLTNPPISPNNKKLFLQETPKRMNSAVNRSFEEPEPMQIKDIYKQPLIVCTVC